MLTCYTLRLLLQSLAAEVVALEEKMLQVRSREIRLEGQSTRMQESLEQSQKQLQSSTQDRSSLQSTIDMLQVTCNCPDNRSSYKIGGSNVSTACMGNWLKCQQPARVIGSNVSTACMGSRHRLHQGLQES